MSVCQEQLVLDTGSSKGNDSTVCESRHGICNAKYNNNIEFGKPRCAQPMISEHTVIHTVIYIGLRSM